MSDTPQTFAAPQPAPAAAASVPAPVETAEAAPAEAANTDLLGSLQSLSVTIVIAIFVITFLLQAFQIPSESMENTLLTGDYLLVDKAHYGQGGVWGRILPYSDIGRGDIIVFRYPVHPAQHFVKRVIGVPGDRIRLLNKRVFVNERPLDEAYAVYHGTGPDAYRDDFPSPEHAGSSVEAGWWLQMRRYVHDHELTVPPGSYFVLGDNRDESLDSRYWGFVPRENIIGRPLLIYWSMRQPDPDGIAGPNGTLSRFAYVMTHLLHFARWDRTLRIVK